MSKIDHRETLSVREAERLRRIERAARAFIEAIDNLERLEGESATLRPRRWATIAHLRKLVTPASENR
jgi:hypothetical protein